MEQFWSWHGNLLGVACAGINPAGREPLLSYQFLCCCETAQKSPLGLKAMLMSLLWLFYVTTERALAFFFFFGFLNGREEEEKEEEKKVFTLLQEGSPTNVNGVKQMLFGSPATRESLSS